MRFIILASVLASALAFAAPSSAQVPPQDRPEASESQTKLTPASRIGSLSPDEERRLARKRARAAQADRLSAGSADKTGPADKNGRADNNKHADKAIEPAPERSNSSSGRAMVPSPLRVTVPAPLRTTVASPVPHERQARRLASLRIRRAVDLRQALSPSATRHAAADQRWSRARLASNRIYPRVGDVVPADIPLYQVPPPYEYDDRYAGYQALPPRPYQFQNW